jgi:hypothetical protein
LQGLPKRKELLPKNLGHRRELLDAAVLHAVSVHGGENTPELREQIKSMLKNEHD